MVVYDDTPVVTTIVDEEVPEEPDTILLQLVNSDTVAEGGTLDHNLQLVTKVGGASVNAVSAITVTLTVTEFLILQSLAQRPGIVKSRDALMDAAYDDQVYVDDRTIDSHIKRLRKKFRDIDGDFDAIETLYGVGYRYNEV